MNVLTPVAYAIAVIAILVVVLLWTWDGTCDICYAGMRG